MTKPLTARIEVFRPGTFTPMDGAPISYSAADLRAIADAYDPATAPAPIVVGHPDLDAPAFGWIEGFEYDADQQRLMAKLHEIEPAFADAVKAGRYKKVSMAFYRPDQDHNPVPGTWYPKHVGFLGAAAPAVSGLKNASFAAAAGVIFTAEFGQAGMQETVSILRAIREFFIEKFGAEDADRVIPGYRLEWMTELSRMEVSEPDDDEPAQAFSAATTSGPGQADMAAQVRAVFDAAFGQREADLAAREAQLPWHVLDVVRAEADPEVPLFDDWSFGDNSGRCHAGRVHDRLEHAGRGVQGRHDHDAAWLVIDRVQAVG